MAMGVDAGAATPTLDAAVSSDDEKPLVATGTRALHVAASPLVAAALGPLVATPGVGAGPAAPRSKQRPVVGDVAGALRYHQTCRFADTAALRWTC